MEENNKFQLISYTAIAVIILSIFSLGLNLTGNVTDTGVVNITVDSIVSINFTTDFFNFSNGSVTLGSSSATLYSENGSTVDGDWNFSAGNLTLENLGNNNVSLELAAGKSAASFLGGTSPGYEYKVSNHSSGEDSCTNTTINLKQFYSVNTTSPGTTICNPFQFVGDRDSIEISILLVVPSDAAAGESTDTFTATATAV
tara:strand:- start:1816 stop:2415 length:600 start_codon:yes stop_codon:yes gene_type:complete